MLKFKNKKGELVMKENDKGELHIFDEKMESEMKEAKGKEDSNEKEDKRKDGETSKEVSEGE